LSSDIENSEYGEKFWPIYYGALLTYGIKYGTCNVPIKKDYKCTLHMGNGYKNYKFKGKLGIWLSIQRDRMISKKLSVDKEAQLHEIIDEG
jgi:hypothetical protein